MKETLPKGWVESYIGDVVGVQNGYAFKTKDFKSHGIPLIKQTNLIGDTIKLEKCQYLDKNFLAERSNFIIKKGDILIGMSGSLGKVSLYKYETPALQNQRTGKLLFYSKNNIYTSLFLYYFTNIGYILEKSGKGCGVQNISGREIEQLIFPLPPLNEQKRIVAKLDKIISRIDSVKERLEKVPTIIKRFRQSVLTAAVTGKLTEKWREENPDVKSAENLLEKIRKQYLDLYKQKKTTKPKALKEINDNEVEFEINDNWRWVRIAQIALKMSTGPFGTMLHKSDYVSNGIPVINPTNIIDDKLIASNKMMISNDTFKSLSKYSLFENDIVIARRGDLGKCGIVTKNEEGWLCGTGSFFLKLGINPIFFRFFYISDFCQSVINSGAIGSTMANLNQKVLSDVPFPLPPMEEQKEIVRQVDNLYALADKLESNYQNAKTKIDKLSQSVLAKAFRGELVPQDPNDEPAEKLLEKIKKEKEKLEEKIKAQKRKKAKKVKK